VHRPWTLAVVGGLVLIAGAVLLAIRTAHSPGQLQNRAEAAARAGDWVTALADWRAVNSTASASSASHLSEARACLALGRASQAERSLQRAIGADSSDLTAWQLLLRILRIEDRSREAEQLGWKAFAQVRPHDRPKLLQELTLSLLADLPDETLRTTLKRWVDADPADVDAQVALWQRIAASPRAADPDRPTLLAALESLLSSHPDHIGVREALIAALADAGEPERGRILLDGWPQATRDARYWRLRGRWDLEYDRHPDQAVVAFQRALVGFPQDWRTWYRLARALRVLGRDGAGRRAAESVSRIRETLDPLTLGPRLDTALKHLNDPAALRDLASLCERAGLKRLADAWRALADGTTPNQTGDQANRQPVVEDARHAN
jgi:tetratricopeptide (TPR) repeat protein